MRKARFKEFMSWCTAPQRICWAVAEHGGKRSICPLGWHMWASFVPPMVAIAIGPDRFTYELLKPAGEFVLAWPGPELADATLKCGTQSGREFDKFAACGLTTLPAATVKTPLVAECLANLECQVRGELVAGDHVVVTAEVVGYWLKADGPARLLCQVNDDPAYTCLAGKGPFRLGMPKG
jgi:flavin reductase (DIM6/NTAB) family NADH-FMN oxidoreductase RutF